jgi:ketosteroid isomerase-like protein
VEEYYNNIAGFLARVRTMTVSDLSVDVFGDMAYAFCNFHFEGDIKGQSQPLRVAHAFERSVNWEKA